MESNNQNSSGRKLLSSNFDKQQLKSKIKKLQANLAHAKQKESFYLSVKFTQTISQLKQAIVREKQQSRHLKRKVDYLQSRLRSGARQRRVEQEDLDTELLNQLALAGQIDPQELRYQQQLWEHRHCRDGHCIHRQSGRNYQQLLQIGEQIGYVNVGLSSEEIEMIPLVEVRNESCSICQSDIEGELARVLECGHVHHKECLDTWLSNKPNCPVCMRSVRDNQSFS